jgi:hypothetical protein
MNKANHFYWQAKSYKQKQQDIAHDFVKECLEEFEEDAAGGCFSATIYRNNVPKSILFDFDELVIPLFLEEGFKVEEYISPRYGYNSSDDGWTISWDLKKENIQYE